MTSKAVVVQKPSLRVRYPDVRVPEHQYLFDVLLGEHLGLQHEAEPVPGLRWIEIDCPGNNRGPTLRVGANLLLRPQAEWLSAAALPLLPLQQWDCRSLLPAWDRGPVPVLYPAVSEPKGRTSGEEIVSLPIDVFGGAFFLLTRYEELIVKERDRHERFRSQDSIACRAGLLNQPLVDEYARLLGFALSQCLPGLECRHPESRIRLSHDVDHPYQFFRKSVGHMACSAGKMLFREPTLRKAWGLARAGARSGFRGDVSGDPFNSYARLLRAGEALGGPSEFYFMAGQSGCRYEEAYDLRSPELQTLLREIHRRGHRIGLHASYSSFKSLPTLAREKDYLLSSAKLAGIDLEAVGGRQHYLRWENPTTWRSWDQVGLAYDASVGFPDCVGFRCGTCHEFPVFDLLERRKLRLRERPLLLMDVTLTDGGRFRPEGITQRLRSLWAAVKSVGGTFEVLIHNCNPQAAWLAEQLCSL